MPPGHPARRTKASFAALLLVAGAAAWKTVPPDASPRLFETAVPIRGAHDLRRASFVRLRDTGTDCGREDVGPTAVAYTRYKSRVLCNSAALDGDDLAMAIARFRERVDADLWARRKYVAARVLTALAAASAVWGAVLAVAAFRLRRRRGASPPPSGARPLPDGAPDRP